MYLCEELYIIALNQKGLGLHYDGPRPTLFFLKNYLREECERALPNLHP